MVLRADIAGAAPVAGVQASAPAVAVADARREAFDRLNQADVGSRFQARILSQLKDGSFILEIADTALRMKLPDGSRVGDTLDMTLIGLRPRPTFLLGQRTDDPAATIGAAARLIDSLLRAAQKDGAAATLVGKAPLLPSSSADAPHIASALQDGLAFSGLFYESHLRQWVEGSRTLTDLMHEPQMMQMTSGSPAALADDSQQAPSAAIRHEATTGGRSLSDPASADGMATDSGHMTDALNIDAHKLIGLQLDALEQKRVQWQGELWPGQKLEWEVKRDVLEHPAEQQANEARQCWQSTVRFELPALGAVSATIQLSGDRVQMHVRAASEPTAATLRRHGGELASALDAAGTHLDLLTVRQDESA
jgi:hypothetical protein